MSDVQETYPGEHSLPELVPVPDPEPTTEAPHLILELDGERALFEAYPEANQYLLVKYADDLSISGFATVNAVTKLALGQVVKAEVSRLEQYLEQHGHADSYSQHIYNALDAVWRGETMLPLARPSSSSGRTDTA